MRKQYIYADNAATTKMDIEAFEAMKPYLLDEYGNASQPYSFARNPKSAIQEARVTIAQCINASPEEIFFTSGGTEGDNWAIKGVVSSNSQCSIVTSQIEHHAVLNACRDVERMGCSVTYLPVSPTGVVEPDTLVDHITSTTKLVSIMYANNEIGTIQPVKVLSQIAHRHGALFHTDAVQAVGHIPIDVKELDVDLLSASAHKFNGPKGIGFVYIKKGTKIDSFQSGGAQEFGLRAGTENVASIVAMACALRNNCSELCETMERLKHFERLLLETLDSAQIDYVRNGDTNHLPGLLSVSFKMLDGESLLHRLDLLGVCVATGAACDSINTKISHVLTAIGVNIQYVRGTIRISFGKHTTLEEVLFVAESLKKAIASAARLFLIKG